MFPEDQIVSFAMRLFLVFWCFHFLRRASSWLESAGNSLLVREFSQTPEIQEFLFRPYVNRYWNASKRLDMIAEHYRLVSSNATFLNLAPDEYIDLVIFDLVQGRLRVVLDRPSWVRREGEIGLSLFLGVDRIYTVMFLLSGTPANMKLIVGCVQGAEIDQGKSLYKELTRSLHGMRPRDFILHLTKMISEELRCKEILGIFDAAHRGNLWYSRAFKHVSYDSIWLEHGGQKTNDGFFSLASRIVKRALYRRRYQFLDELQVLLRGVVAFPPPKKQHMSNRGLIQQ